MNIKRRIYLIYFLVPYIWIAFFYNQIPNKVYNIGKASFIGYCFVANLLITLFLSYLLKSNKRQPNMSILNKLILILTIVINIFPLILILFASKFSVGFNLPKGISLICGLIFLIFAVYFPKIKQNKVIGIKTKWTLKSEEVWDKTHQIGVITWIIGGTLFIGNIFAGSQWMYVLNIVLGLCLIIIVPYIYSFVVWNKEQKNQ